jgi:hypothetical protein
VAQIAALSFLVWLGSRYEFGQASYLFGLALFGICAVILLWLAVKQWSIQRAVLCSTIASSIFCVLFLIVAPIAFPGLAKGWAWGEMPAPGTLVLLAIVYAGNSLAGILARESLNNSTTFGENRPSFQG